MSSAINAVAHAVVSALVKDLEPVVYPAYKFTHDKQTGRTERVRTGEVEVVRPREDQCVVHCFPQTWGSTALGFGGLGGAAMTTAYTVVVIGPGSDACVYFDGRLAYCVKNPNEKFLQDMLDRQLAPVRDQDRYHTKDGKNG